MRNPDNIFKAMKKWLDNHSLEAAGVLFLTGICVLAGETLTLPYPPTPFQLLRLGFTGACLMPVAVATGAVALAGRSGRGFSPVFSLLYLGLCLFPVSVGGDWSIPVFDLVSWAQSGSIDAIVALFFVVLPGLAMVLHLVMFPFPRVRLWAALVLVSCILVMPFANWQFQQTLYRGAATHEAFGSALRMVLGFLLVYQGWKQLGPVLLDTELWPRYWGEWLPALGRSLPIVVLLGVFFIVKLETTGPGKTDENIYFYAAHLFASGKMPYRDFFFAHPPLHVLVPGLFVLLFGFSLSTIKLLSILLAASSGLFLFLGTRRLAGSLAGLMTAGFFLFAHEQLQASTNLTGINLTVMFLCAAFAFAASRRFLVAGVLAGCAILSGVYGLGLSLALLALVCWFGFTAFVTYFAALSATFLGGNLLCRALFGKPYFEQVYHYHLLKQVKVEGLLDPAAADLVSFVAIGLAICLGLVIAGDIAHNQPSSGTRLRGIIEGRAGRLKVAGLAISLLIGIGLSLGSTPSGLVLLAHNVSLLLGGAEWQKMSYFHAHHSLALLTAGVALTVWAVFSRWSGLKLGNLYLVALTGAACACAATAELSMLRETYTFYYVLLFPGTAMLLGVSWTVIIRLSCAELSPATGFTALLTGLGKLLMPAVAVAVFALYIPDAVSIGQERFTSEHKDAGQLFCYRRIHPTNTVFSDFVRSRFLTPCRLKGNLEPGIFHALWKKSWHLSRAGEIARYIAANSEPDETIIGSSLLTPLLSLLSGREIAAGYVDTNSKRFKSGIDVSDSEVQAACRNSPGAEPFRCRARASERKMWLAVCATKVRFIVSGPRSFFTPKRMQRHPLVRKFFKPVRLFNEDKVNLSGRYPIMLLRRISDQPQADGSWCSYGSR